LATLWTVKEAVWKTLHCGGQVAMPEISIEPHAGVLRPNVKHSAFKDVKFRMQLFVVGCDAIVPETICLTTERFGNIKLRGCVTQRIT
jgi:phosphopantetheinyl transferase